MVAVGKNRVLSVGMVGPDRIRQKFKLRLRGPILDLATENLILSDDLLQKTQIGSGLPDGLTDQMKGELLRAQGESFVNIVA